MFFEYTENFMTNSFKLSLLSIGMLIVPATSQAMVSAIPAEALCKAFAQKAQYERCCEKSENTEYTLRSYPYTRYGKAQVNDVETMLYLHRIIRSEEREAKQLAGRFGSKIILRSYPYTRYGSAQVNDIEAMLCLRRILRRSEEREAQLLAGRFGSKIIFNEEEKNNVVI